jgi:DNA-binding transcriptional LysR family regulator
MPPSSDDIATFVAVVRQQGLSAAARGLGLPKSTVSRRLARLESQLQNKLLHRDARRVTLTPAGRSFYASVVGAVDALDAAVTSLAQSSRAPRGSIRITAPPDLGRMVLAPMLVAFLEQQPEIWLELSLGNRVVDLAEESIDLALRAGRVIKGDLIARKVCESELQLAGSPALAARLQASDDIRSLERQPFVLYRAQAQSQRLKLERVGKKKSVELNVSGRLNVDDYAGLAELVAAGQGFGQMPAIHVQEGVRSGRLTRIFADWTTRAAYVYLVYPARQQPERVRLLLDFLIAAFGAVEHV